MYRGPRAKRGNSAAAVGKQAQFHHTQAGRASLPEEGASSSSINTCMPWAPYSELTPGCAVRLEQGAVLSQCVSFTTGILCKSTKRKCCQGSPGRGMSLQAQCHVTPHLLSYAMNLVGRRSYEYGSFRDTAHQQIKKANMGPRGSVTSCRLGAVTGGTPAPAQALPNGFARVPLS